MSDPEWWRFWLLLTVGGLASLGLMAYGIRGMVRQRVARLRAEARRRSTWRAR